eukprot:TRINITY_DN32790_c0_g1_i1.p1 TRINITY_DN32790_c0_g1~~TRINITY_DN32790_c0_g1_i1.p1  ORF type:complete len:197 (-),score=36.84 TRINITY_DN32790_c0_g1_i1:82-672(-)
MPVSAGQRSGRVAVFSLLAMLLVLCSNAPNWSCWHHRVLSNSNARSLQRSKTAMQAAAVQSEETPMMLAAHQNNAAEIKSLVAAGEDLNLQDQYGWTALRYAVRANNKEAATALLKAGASVDLASHSGRTPLMSAAANGLIDMVKLLIQEGADVQKQNTNGDTSLALSMRGGKTGCAECRKLLHWDIHSGSFEDGV